MIVYHGGTTRIEMPQIIRSEIGRDFGFAFYTADIQDQAERWALRRAKIENRCHEKSHNAIINIYEWNKYAPGLSRKEYPNVSMEWLEMVMRCRSDVSFCHNFDIVEGKIANDNVGETISYVMLGIMRKEDALERLKFEKINNQIAFCTEMALGSLTFKDSYMIEVN